MSYIARCLPLVFLVCLCFTIIEAAAATISQSGTWDLHPIAPKINGSANEAACIAAASIAASASAPDEAACIAAAVATAAPDTTVPYVCEKTMDYVCQTDIVVIVNNPWVVKRINDQTTRPAYTLINGVLGTKEMARATIGMPCDITKPTLASGTYRYAQYDATGYVTLCWQVP